MKRVSNRLRKILLEGKIEKVYHIGSNLKFYLIFEDNIYSYRYFIDGVPTDWLYNLSSSYIFNGDGRKTREIFLKRVDVRSIIVKHLLTKER